MGYKVAIRYNATGEVRICQINLTWGAPNPGNPDGDLSWWTDGNMGCDCNRVSEFNRAGGEQIDEKPFQCTEGNFTALYADLPDGRRVIIEDPDEAQNRP
jgi:hypothetical protein